MDLEQAQSKVPYIDYLPQALILVSYAHDQPFFQGTRLSKIENVLNDLRQTLNT